MQEELPTLLMFVGSSVLGSYDCACSVGFRHLVMQEPASQSEPCTVVIDSESEEEKETNRARWTGM